MHGLITLVDTAELLATELISNAVLHTKGPAALRVRWSPPGTLRLGAWDADPEPPEPPGPLTHLTDAENGRGISHRVEPSVVAGHRGDKNPPSHGMPMRQDVRMTRNTGALLSLLLLPVLLTGCGADKEEGTARTAAGLDAAAKTWGVEPELVYVTEVSGYTVFQASVGEYEGEFVAAYRSKDRATQFGLFVNHRKLTAENCSKRPLGGVTDKRVSCERDGDAWYRKAGASHEYAIPRDGVVIELIAGAEKVDRAVLRKAAEAVHRPDDDELAALLPATNGADS